MNEAIFTKQNSKIWADLEALLINKKNSFDRIERLTSLYRIVSGHLNYARYHYRGSRLCDYLEELTSRAHNMIYANAKPRQLRRFFSLVLPLSIKANVRVILISAAIFWGAALISFMIGMFAPQYIDAFLPENFTTITDDQPPADESAVAVQGGAVLSNLIMINNINVAALAFALGITFGVGTVYILVTNGLLIGALASLFAGSGKSLLFWSLILPHGVWELTAIFIAGGAGLRLGYSLIRPGAFRRKDALITAARSSISLMGMVVLLLIVAAMIEGYFTPLPIAAEIKLLVAAITALPLIWYFIVFTVQRPEVRGQSVLKSATKTLFISRGRRPEDRVC